MFKLLVLHIASECLVFVHPAVAISNDIGLCGVPCWVMMGVLSEVCINIMYLYKA